MNVIRLSGDNHYNECFEISKLRPKVGGTKPIPTELFLETHKKYFENNDNYYAMGCIENDKIISLKIYDKKDGTLVLNINNPLNLQSGNHQFVPHPDSHPNPTTQTTCPKIH